MTATPSLYAYDFDQTHDLLWAQSIDPIAIAALGNFCGDRFFFRAGYPLPVQLIERYCPGGSVPWASEYSAIAFEFLKRLSRTKAIADGNISGMQWGLDSGLHLSPDFPDDPILPDEIELTIAANSDGFISWLQRSHTDVFAGKPAPEYAQPASYWIRRSRVFEAVPFERKIKFRTDQFLINSLVTSPAIGLPSLPGQDFLRYSALGDALQYLLDRLNIPEIKALVSVDIALSVNVSYTRFRPPGLTSAYSEGIDGLTLSNPQWEAVPEDWYYASRLVAANNPWGNLDETEGDLGKPIALQSESEGIYLEIWPIDRSLQIGEEIAIALPGEGPSVREKSARWMLFDSAEYMANVRSKNVKLTPSRDFSIYFPKTTGIHELNATYLQQIWPSVEYATTWQARQWFATPGPNYNRLDYSANLYYFPLGNPDRNLFSEGAALAVYNNLAIENEGSKAWHQVAASVHPYDFSQEPAIAWETELPYYQTFSRSQSLSFTLTRTLHQTSPESPPTGLSGDVATPLIDSLILNAPDPDTNGLTMADSARIKDIHAALQADRYSKDDTNPNDLRVANLGWLIYKIAQALGLHFKSDGEMIPVPDTKHVKPGDKIPENFQFNQFGKNRWKDKKGNYQEGVGIVYEVRSNYFGKDIFQEEIIEEGGYVLCHSLLQYLDQLQDDNDRAFGLQDLGANVLPKADGSGYVLYQGLHSLLMEMAYAISALSVNISQSHVLAMKNNAMLAEMMAIAGQPITIKEIVCTMNGQEVKIPYQGVKEGTPSLVDFFVWILSNQALVTASQMSIKEKEKED